MRRMIAGALGVLMLTLALAGCADAREKIDQTGNVPAPSAQAHVFGNSENWLSRSVSLYFYNQDRTNLVSVVREVQYSESKSLAEAAVEWLLGGPEYQPEVQPSPSATAAADQGVADSGFLAVVPEDVKLLGIEQSENVVLVNLNSAFKNLSPKDQFAARLAITNTLTVSSEEIQWVGIFVEGVLYEGDAVEPMGLMSKTNRTLEEAWREHSMEVEEQQEMLTAERIYTRQVTLPLFFKDINGAYLLIEPRSVQLTNNRVENVKIIISELRKGPIDPTRMTSVLPSQLTLLDAPTFGEGENVTQVTLNFSSHFNTVVQGTSSSDALVLGSVVESLCACFPDLNAIAIQVEGKPIAAIPEKNFTEGLMKKTDFSGLVGDTVLLYFAHPSMNSLVPVTRAMSQTGMRYMIQRLEQIMLGPLQGESAEATPIFLEGETEDIFESVTVEGDLALVNLSDSFYEECQSLSEVQERMLVYSIVNTLTEMPTIRRVQFFRAGQSIEKLSGYLYMTTPFMRNPGLIKEGS